MEPLFTEDWFSGNIGTWSQILREFRGNPVRALEIGSFQGRSTRWLLEDILTHPASRITCVDTFKGSVEHSAHHIRNMRELFEHNIQPFAEKVDILEGNSQVVLRTHAGAYDFAYVDGDHRAFAVLEDTIHAFRLLKYGGILIFDDYLWLGGKRPIDNPRPAIDAFMALNADRFVLLHSDYQVILRKIVHE